MSIITATLGSTALLVLLASGAQGADWRDQPAAGQHPGRSSAAPIYVELVPDCHESWNTDLLRCAPRTRVPDPDALPVVLRRKSVFAGPRKPYPQIFSWDTP